jgi:tetratricopeptide (TPR) repeat protein
MSLLPTDPKKIRERIRRYERIMRKEQEETGYISDGYGKRFMLGAMYLLLKDTAGALRHYAWYEETLPDDSGYPMDLLCWALALYRTGNLEAAARKLRKAMFSNLYLLPHLLSIQQDELDIWHSSSWEWPDHLNDIPQEVFALWDRDALDWARTVYLDPDTQQARGRYIEIFRQLKTEPRGPKRFQLVDEASRLTSTS